MIKIVGGTYDEFCLEPHWDNKFGSGLRACYAINAIDPKLDIEFYTFANKTTKAYLEQMAFSMPKVKSFPTQIEDGVSFYYDYPLITPRISPRPDSINKQNNSIEVKGDKILYYGFLEGNAKITGERVVYDPQSPANPISFSATGSTANELAMVINLNEAYRLTGSKDIQVIKQFFLREENASIIVLKMGAKGGLVIKKDGTEEVFPVYKTESVWPIGSGDVFAAIFAYEWLHEMDSTVAAQKASRLTASYCNSRNFGFELAQQPQSIVPLLIKEFPIGQVYLAGPFFNFAEKWLIDQIRAALMGLGMNVFSPLHDVGHGSASVVVDLDLKGLDESKIVFAVLDGLDSGTLFEIGYAIAKKIPVIVYVESESEESIKMLEGTNCVIERDLTTAIYKCLWLLAENE